MPSPSPDYDIVGAGPAGLLLALLLARRGHRVAVHERRSDPRIAPPEAGRSINLALAARGLAALERAGLRASLDDLLVPMRGRRVHDLDGTQNFVPYGQRENEVIHSIPRSTLTLRLTQAASCERGITLHFDSPCTGVDERGHPVVEGADGQPRRLEAPRCIAADGAGSAVRRGLQAAGRVQVREEMLGHDYKELELPLRHGRPALETDALHIWPRGGFMLIALPNADGSFTATLFLPPGGPQGFRSLEGGAAVEAFFAREFADVAPLIPQLPRQFAEHPQGYLGTVYAAPWNVGERLMLLGDAAHAIVPFHGQGMNCAFEDCHLLDERLASGSSQAFAQYAAERPRDTDAIAAMALENYGEMRDTVREPRFLLQKELSLALERLHPRQFVPRYAMVMFHAEIPYHVAQARGRVQQQVLDELTAHATRLDEVDWAAAARLVGARLPPL
jgi:kynurenine 3-monooxygenase